MNTNSKLLIVEDELKVANFIKKGLLTQGWDSEIAQDGKTAIQMFQNQKFDLVILDIGLPDISGIEVCEKLRVSNKKVPILMLTAMGSIADKLSGYEVGTDDYLVKPFDFMELIVRLKVLLKRCKEDVLNDERLQIADLELDLNEKIAIRAGHKIELTAKEFGLLEFLMRSNGRVCSKVDIAEKVWDINFDRGTNYVEVYVNYLRNKIDRGFTEKLIHTVVGMGYSLKIK